MIPTVAQVREAFAANGENQSKTAKQLGISRHTVQRRLAGEEAEWIDENPLESIVSDLRKELDVVRQSLLDTRKPRMSIRTDTAGENSEIRVLVIGDAHDDPTIPDKTRFEYAGRYAADQKVDVLLSIGDFLNCNSLCFHIPDENYSGKAKPTFLADMASGKLAFDALNSGLGNWKPEKAMTMGTHENRLFRMEDQSPSSVGMYQALFDEVMENAGFEYTPYGATTFYGGVGFTHIPLSIMGKPMGGKTVLQSLGRDSVYDTVTGHTHVPGEVTTRKIRQRHITTVDAGCYLPDGHVEDFATHTYGGWGWGLTDLRIKGRHIHSRKWISSYELGVIYG